MSISKGGTTGQPDTRKVEELHVLNEIMFEKTVRHKTLSVKYTVKKTVDEHNN